MGICLICCWHGMNNQSNILFSFLLFHCMDLMWLCHTLLLAPLNLQIKRHHPLCSPPHVQNKLLTYGLFVFNFWKMFYAFLIATDTTTIKTERKALSLPTKHFYVIPNKHTNLLNWMQVRWSIVETKAPPLRKREKIKRKVGLAKIMKLDVVGIY